MKQFRCPWCGKATITSLERFSLATGNRLRFFNRISRTCDETTNRASSICCSMPVQFSVFNKGVLWVPIVGGVILTSFTIFAILGVVLYNFLFLVFAFVSAAVFGLYYFIAKALFLPLVKQDNVEEFKQDKLILDVSLDTELKLKTEHIFAIKLKGIAPEKVLSRHGEVNDYIRYGIAAHFEKLQGNTYRLDVIEPINYDPDNIAAGTEFDLLGVEGEVISTGRIESVSTEIPKE